MYIYLIRHAQSTNNALDDISQRAEDAELTPLGHQQAARLAQHLATATDNPTRNGYTISKLYCSAMHRALQTARPVSEALGLQPHVWVDIHENGGVYLDNNNGDGATGYPGLTRAQVAAQFPDYVLPDDLTDQGWWDVNQGRETDGRYGRAIRVALALRAQAASDDHIALISHAGFLSLLLAALSNQLPEGHSRSFYYHNNTAITLLEINAENRLIIHYTNRVDHLPLDMQTW